VGGSNLVLIAFESALCSFKIKDKCSILDINNVLWTIVHKGVFYMFAKTLKSFCFTRTFGNSRLGDIAKGKKKFAYYQSLREGGELLWSNLLPLKQQYDISLIEYVN